MGRGGIRVREGVDSVEGSYSGKHGSKSAQEGRGKRGRKRLQTDESD